MDAPSSHQPEARPSHWHYSRCGWQSRFVWEERVAMSELGIGPDQVNQNAGGRVTGVFLRDRNIPDEHLAHLSGFPFLTGVLLNGSPVTDACIEYLIALPHLRSLWIVGTRITDAGVKRIEKAKPDALVFSKHGQAAIPGPDGRWIMIGPGNSSDM